MLFPSHNPRCFPMGSIQSNSYQFLQIFFFQNALCGFSYRSICCAERNTFHEPQNIQKSGQRMGCRSFTIYIVTFTSLQDPLRIDCIRALVCAFNGKDGRSQIFFTNHAHFEHYRSFHLFSQFYSIICNSCCIFFFIFSQVNKERNMAMSDFRRNKLVYVFKAFFGLFTFPKIRFQLMMLSSVLPNFPSRCG